MSYFFYLYRNGNKKYTIISPDKSFSGYIIFNLGTTRCCSKKANIRWRIISTLSRSTDFS